MAARGAMIKMAVIKQKEMSAIKVGWNSGSSWLLIAEVVRTTPTKR